MKTPRSSLLAVGAVAAALAFSATAASAQTGCYACYTQSGPHESISFCNDGGHAIIGTTWCDPVNYPGGSFCLFLGDDCSYFGNAFNPADIGAPGWLFRFANLNSAGEASGDNVDVKIRHLAFVAQWPERGCRPSERFAARSGAQLE